MNTYNDIKKDGLTYTFITHVNPSDITYRDNTNKTLSFTIGAEDEIEVTYKDIILSDHFMHNGFLGVYSSQTPPQKTEKLIKHLPHLNI